MRAMLAFLLLLLAFPARAENIPLTAERWTLQAAAEFVQHDGRQAVRLGNGADGRLRGGAATITGSNFSTGTIEFDVLPQGNRDFLGVAFREDQAGNAELFYIRTHMNGNPDSTQYTPVVNGSWAWQIFTNEGFTSQRRFDLTRWMHVRIDVYERSALVTVNGEPALVVPHLKGTTRTGAIGLNAAAGAYFANVNVTPIPNYRDPRPEVPLPALPPGTVPAWQVSPAIAEADGMARAARRDWSGIEWQRLAVESNGIANLSRAGADGEGRHTYVARFTARSRTAQTATMRFGFSDKVRIFVNGRPVYEGSDVQGSRDYRFLGLVGFWDTLFLPLEAGANEITFVVTDGTNGGTAALAQFDPAEGLTLE
jgi:hypothetical protein